MTMNDEKPSLEQRSAEAERETPEHSLKQKDEENTTATHIPHSDEEYNVTLKTWCVVLVSMFEAHTSCFDLTVYRFFPCHTVSASGLCRPLVLVRQSRQRSWATLAPPLSMSRCTRYVVRVRRVLCKL
jgi:hypothetical protein